MEAEQKAVFKELAKAEHSRQSFTAWQANLDSLRKAIKQDDPEHRMRLNGHLRELIEKIEVFPVGYKKQYEAGDSGTRSGKGRRASPQSDDLAETFEAGIWEADPKYARSKEFRSFIAYVMQRRMSKEGRFYRVHFKTGAVIDLVPEGSIASGSRFDAKASQKLDAIKQSKRKNRATEKPSRWQTVQPKYQQLWQDYVKQNGGSV